MRTKPGSNDTRDMQALQTNLPERSKLLHCSKNLPGNGERRSVQDSPRIYRIDQFDRSTSDNEATGLSGKVREKQVPKTAGCYVVIQQSGVDAYRHRIFECQCSLCGRYRIIRLYNLLNRVPICPCRREKHV